MNDQAGETYLEFHQIGQSIKVTAIDPVSFEEVSIVAPADATRQEMTQIAVRKLQRRLERLEAEKVSANAKPKKAPLSRGPGILA